MKISIIKKHALFLLTGLLLLSCEDFLEVDAPDHKIVSAVVFDNDETAMSAMTGIYNHLVYVIHFSSGSYDSVTALAGLSSDVLTTIRTNNRTYMEFEEHELQSNNPRNLKLWASSYNAIYLTNSLLEGLESSASITDEVRKRLEGEAKFVRAFTYFYLVNLFGDVPLVLTTDYRQNALAPRNGQEEIYQQIIEDLEAAVELLHPEYPQGVKTQVNRTTAIAMLARVNLFLQNWQLAENLSSEVISETNTYEILEDLNQVFLANSREAIWQLNPGGSGYTTYTNEGSTFIINPFLSFLSNLKLADGFVSSFDEEDKRFSHWINFHSGLSIYYPFKYKIRATSPEIPEYSMVLRLAEQYLIRAEARVMQDDIAGAISDLDIIRGRAGLELIADTNQTIGKEAILELIMEERKKELFTEWGHRWLDLKRTGRAGDIMGANNPFWEETDVYYPIPDSERIKNPNLTQNDGY